MVYILGIEFELAGEGLAHEYQVVYEAPDTLFGGMSKASKTIYMNEQVNLQACEVYVGSMTMLEFGCRDFDNYLCIKPERLISFVYVGASTRAYSSAGSKDADGLEEIKNYLRDRKKINAIQALRRIKDLSLLEAKEWVEAYMSEFGISE